MNETFRVLFDATRLLSRCGFSTPTGIDRVDLAYLRAMKSNSGIDLHLVIVDQWGWRALSDRDAQRLLAKVTTRWESFADPSAGVAREKLREFLDPPPGTTADADQPSRRKRATQWQNVVKRAIRVLRRPMDGTRLRKLSAEAREVPTVYVNTSHGHLYRARTARWLSSKDFAKVFMVHDLIPIHFPQYNRAREPTRHRARLRTVSTCASHIITNSMTTAESLTQYLRSEALRLPPMTARHLGIDSRNQSHKPPSAWTSAIPYFVCIGTLEPRKNHRLLLDVWEQLIHAAEQPVPHLILIGRRGWENQVLFERLDRDPLFVGHIVECAGLGDDDVLGVLRGARALLNPSFTEGFGLPVVEALAAGTPAIVSAIAAHREVGLEFAEYLRPDVPSEWIAAIRDFADPLSDRRRRRLESLKQYRAPSWAAHFETIIPILRTTAEEASSRARSQT